MAKLTKQQIADKTAELTSIFGDYVFSHPDILNAIPDDAVLVLLDESDPVFNREAERTAKRNRSLCQESGEGQRPLVYVTVGSKLARKTVRVPKLTMELEPV